MGKEVGLRLVGNKRRLGFCVVGFVVGGCVAGESVTAEAVEPPDLARETATQSSL